MPTLNEKFLEACRKGGGREVFIRISEGSRETCTYTELKDRAVSVAAWLRGQGFKKGGRVMIVMDNGPEWVMVYFGILLAGGVCVPLDPQTGLEDVQGFIKDAGARMCFCSGKTFGKWSGKPSGIDHLVRCGGRQKEDGILSLEEVFASGGREADAKLPPVQEGDTAAVLYSSGTTSDPKGVELSHRNFWSNYRSIHNLHICSSSDVFIDILPLFHAYAFMASLVVPFFEGARVVFPASMQSEVILEAVRAGGVTILVGVPELFNKIHRSILQKVRGLSAPKRALLKIAGGLGWAIRRTTGVNLLRAVYHPVHQRFGNKLRYMISGGARLDPGVAGDFQRLGFRIIEGYGLTETSPIVSLNPPERPRIGSAGRPLREVEVRIAEREESGHGEILVRGENVMKGYYGKPRLTRESVRAGWFHTGDLGYLDRDGYLFISGRKKEVIVLGSGKNIFPDEIEKQYLKSPVIAELGVFLSEKKGDEGLRAVAVPDFEHFRESGQVNIREKIKWDIENISREMPSYKRINGFVISKEELPKTRLGKIKRYHLPAIYDDWREKSSREDTDEGTVHSAISQSAVGQEVISFLKEELEISRPLRSDDHLELDLGIDSLTRVELLSALEKRFQVRVPDEAMVEITNLEDLIVKIETLRKTGGLKGPKAKRSESDYWQEVLFSELPEEARRKADLSPSRFNRAVSLVLKNVIWGVFKACGRIQVFGRERIPRAGPCIFVCNHSSYLDAFAVIAGLPFETALQTYFIGTRDIFEHRAIRWANRFIRVITIDSAAELIKSMQASSYVLRDDKILCLFPEGQRSIDGRVQPFKKGIGILGKELGVRIVPVAVWGTHRAWPRGVRFPRPHAIRVAFGESVEPKALLEKEGSPEGGKAYQAITGRLQDIVIDLYDGLRRADRDGTR